MRDLVSGSDGSGETTRNCTMYECTGGSYTWKSGAFRMISTDWAPVGLGIPEQEPRIPVQAEAQAGEKRQTGFR